jgi:hypothetical protein
MPLTGRRGWMKWWCHPLTSLRLLQDLFLWGKRG